MSLEHALEQELIKLRNDASIIEQQVKANRGQRDQYQQLLNDAEARLADKQELIEYLEATKRETEDPHGMAHPWHVGDRFKWKDGGAIRGTVVAMGPTVTVKSNDDGVINLSFTDFDRYCEKLS